MGGWSLVLCVILLLLCLSGGNGQELGTDEEATTIYNDEVVPTPQSPSRIQFPKDRIPSGVSKRIIGGNVATANAYPYQVALYVLVQGSLYFCGGTLITTEWVLTAAHCVDGASSVRVLLGAHDISQAEPTRVTLNSSTFVIHAGWDETILQNDIALIRLPRNVTLGGNITVVDLAQGTETYSGVVARCLGWGRTILGALSSVLRYVDAEVITNENCGSYEDYTPYIVDHHICTSGEGTVGSCNGDSGGPLIIDGIQVGIVSFGVTNCSAGLPSVFTRLTEFSSWITENVGTWSGSDNVTTGLGGHGARTVPSVGVVYVGVMVTVAYLNYW